MFHILHTLIVLFACFSNLTNGDDHNNQLVIEKCYLTPVKSLKCTTKLPDLNNHGFIRQICLHRSPTSTSSKPLINCGIETSDGYKNNVISVLRKQFSCITIELQSNSSIHSGRLICTTKITENNNIKILNATENFELITQSKDVYFTNNSKYRVSNEQYNFWMVGVDANFSFNTKFEFGTPEHTCNVQHHEEGNTNKCPLHGTRLQPLLSYTEAAHNTKKCLFCKIYITNYSVPINSSMVFCSIVCESYIKGASSVNKRIKKIHPPFVYPEKALFVLPTSSTWLHGANVTVTVNYTQCNWPVGTSYRCSLQSDAQNISLTVVSSTGNGSFTVSVPVIWNRTAAIVCSVILSEVTEYTNRKALPRSLVQAKFDNITFQNKTVVSGFTATFLMSLTDAGYPISEHSCFINTGVQKSVLRKMPSELSSASTWSFLATESHHRQSIICQVTQTASDGNVVYNQTFPSLPIDVFFKANVTGIQIQNNEVLSGFEVNFTVKSVNAGNPLARHNCTINGRSNLLILKQPSEYEAYSIWSFVASETDNQQRILCCMTQTTPDGAVVFNQPVDSAPIDVKYKSYNHWTADSTITLKENQSQSINITSSGGNPEPSHQCLIKLLSGSNEALTLITEQISPLKSSFTVVFLRHMNGGSLICTVQQNGRQDMTQFFEQKLVVFYEPIQTKMNPLSVLYDGVEAQILVKSSECNPPVHHTCQTDKAPMILLSHRPNEYGFESRFIFTPTSNCTIIWCSSLQNLTDSQIIYNDTHFWEIKVSEPPIIARYSKQLMQMVTVVCILVIVFAILAILISLYKNITNASSLKDAQSQLIEKSWIGQTELEWVKPAHATEINLDTEYEYVEE